MPEQFDMADGSDDDDEVADAVHAQSNCSYIEKSWMICMILPVLLSSGGNQQNAKPCF